MIETDDGNTGGQGLQDHVPGSVAEAGEREQVGPGVLFERLAMRQMPEPGQVRRHAQPHRQPLPTRPQRSFAEDPQLIGHLRRQAGGRPDQQVQGLAVRQQPGPEYPQRAGPRIPPPRRTLHFLNPRLEHRLRADALGPDEMALHGRIGRQDHRRPPAGAADARAEPELEVVHQVAAGFVDRAAEAGTGEEPPGIVLRAADGTPDEGHVQPPQIARLAVPAKRHQVRQIETDFLVQPPGHPVGLAVPVAEDHVPGGIVDLAPTPLPPANRHEHEVQARNRAMRGQIAADFVGELVLFADHPGVEVFGRLHRAAPTGPGLRPAHRTTGVGQLQDPRTALRS